MGALALRIYREMAHFEVWIGPSEEMATGNIINAHIIGLGETRELALADAQREAANVLALLSTGDVPELGSC
mgnify:CR=1 FL=1